MPTKPPRTWREGFRDARARIEPQDVWKACLLHHKLFCLRLDSQTWVFSAPERAAIFHLSLWINALLLVLLLGGAHHRRPGQDPVCPIVGFGDAGCLLQG
eukprot:CAMPEP_0115124878 /NCGR_PEP_ID=MMETSP0227-20121206/48636_1 /TAXON_ID=89957 /ORGANISM="Polarella glacialis, Strain CCMP 1383" /LENGTH=99 /DNA_ID=CAMNT_0002527997 /DNA_START=1 /DNA_END=296 /DNA_ORIENTATION=-